MNHRQTSFSFDIRAGDPAGAGSPTTAFGGVRNREALERSVPLAMIEYRAIAFVAYPVTRMARARKFYEGVLGLKSNGFAKGRNPHWIEYDLGPSTLGIGASPMWQPSKKGASAALEVKDFDAAVAHLKKHRIKFVIGPMDGPACRMVTVRDPDGNSITLHHRKRRSNRP